MIHSLFWNLTLFFYTVPIVYGKIKFSIPPDTFVDYIIEVKWSRESSDPVDFIVQKENPSFPEDSIQVSSGQSGPGETSGVVHFTFRGTGTHRIQAVDPKNTQRVFSTSEAFDVHTAPTPAVTLAVPTSPTSYPNESAKVSATTSSSRTELADMHSFPSSASGPGHHNLPSSTVSKSNPASAILTPSGKHDATIIISTLVSLFILLGIIGLFLYLRRTRKRRGTAGNFNRDMMVRTTVYNTSTPLGLSPVREKGSFNGLAERGISPVVIPVDFRDTIFKKGEDDWYHVGDDDLESKESSSLGHTTPSVGYAR